MPRPILVGDKLEESSATGISVDSRASVEGALAAELLRRQLVGRLLKSRK